MPLFLFLSPDTFIYTLIPDLTFAGEFITSKKYNKKELHISSNQSQTIILKRSEEFRVIGNKF